MTRRHALLGVAVLVALAAAGLAVFLNSLDHVVKAAIETWGPRIAGVPVTVGSVRLSARDGRGRVEGLEVGTPVGFTVPRTLVVARIAVSVDPATLADDVVTIREIVVESPRVAYEPRGRTNNLEALQRNIDAAVRRSADPGARGGTEPVTSGRRYRIGRIVLRGASVTLRSPVPGTGDIGFGLPDVEIRDLGTRGEGVTAAQAAKAVNAALTARIAQKLLTDVDLLRRGGLQGAADALRGLLR